MHFDSYERKEPIITSIFSMLIHMLIVFVQLASKTHLYFQLNGFFLITITHEYSSKKNRNRNRYDSTTFSHP